MFLDVDCTNVLPSTPVSQPVLDALEKIPSKIYILEQPRAKDIVDLVVKRTREAKNSWTARSELAKDKKHCNWPYGPKIDIQNPPTKAETKGENSCTSLLAYLKPWDKEEIVEAYCRDIDAYSEVFKVGEYPGKSCH